ncbi:hypothetical protein IW245_007656 [Longispora fulva]|uniref:Uncharacterized protein n=1 Tax=Longispora fulva TaxID=619741 RepID=A0A8J7KU48_9ACTN|nr:hypothetical protein [Longispora fulva]
MRRQLVEERQPVDDLQMREPHRWVAGHENGVRRREG